MGSIGADRVLTSSYSLLRPCWARRGSLCRCSGSGVMIFGPGKVSITWNKASGKSDFKVSSTEAGPRRSKEILSSS